jgi:hypothetical protein
MAGWIFDVGGRDMILARASTYERSDASDGLMLANAWVRRSMWNILAATVLGWVLGITTGVVRHGTRREQ